MIKQMSMLVAGIGLSGWLSLAVASPVSIPNTFTSGTKAVAAQVNGNFTAVKTAVNDNNSRITKLEKSIATLTTSLDTANKTIATLQTSLNKVTKNSVLALDGDLVYKLDTNGHPTAQFTGVNVQVVNGTGQETTINGLGNLIVGYNNPRASVYSNVCSDGQYFTQAACEGAGDTWAISFKSGSHNLVVGDYNNYSQYGGVVFGDSNIINGAYSVVSGGSGNIARGQYSSVSGGFTNTASRDYSSVSGGSSNIASGQYSSVSGGSGNTANGDTSSVSGGVSSIATGQYSSVSGGYSNAASGDYSSVSGGGGNAATGQYSSVSGGKSVSSTTQEGWAAGSYHTP